MTARVAESGLSHSPEIAACSVLTARCRVRRSNKIGIVVLEGRLSWRPLSFGTAFVSAMEPLVAQRIKTKDGVSSLPQTQRHLPSPQPIGGYFSVLAGLDLSG